MKVHGPEFRVEGFRLDFSRFLAALWVQRKEFQV